MTPEEKIYQIALDWRASKVAGGQFLGLIRMEIESALAERTEQCAKIAEDLAAFWKKEETRIDLNEDAKVYCHGRQTVLKAAATQIRALNQSENKS